MEPVTLILTALVTGAAKAAGDAAPDAYKGLKALIQKKFASQPKPAADRAAMVLEEHEKKPEIYEAALKEKLTEAGVDQDPEILSKAEELIKLLQPEAGSVNNSLQVGGDFKGIGNMSGGTANQTIS